jgi:hypothetical protein
MKRIRDLEISKEIEPDELKKLYKNAISNTKNIIASNKAIIAIESESLLIHNSALRTLLDISTMAYSPYNTAEITDAFIAFKKKYLRDLEQLEKQKQNENKRNVLELWQA